jgi:hypothetical protein
MDETREVEQNLVDLLNVMVSRAEKEVDAVMPGYTHLQVRELHIRVLAAIHLPANVTMLTLSALNPSDGRIFCCPTHNLSSLICNVFVNSTLEFRFFLSAPLLSPETPTASTESSSGRSFRSNPLAKTLCTPSPTAISS